MLLFGWDVYDLRRANMYAGWDIDYLNRVLKHCTLASI